MVVVGINSSFIILDYRGFVVMKTKQKKTPQNTSNKNKQIKTNNKINYTMIIVLCIYAAIWIPTKERKLFNCVW